MPPRKKIAQVELKAGPDRCEEASTLSGESYIPCNAPAVAVVGWTGRPDQPIRMCAMCEAHNIKNRGGYRVAPFGAAVIDEALATSGHNNPPPSDNDLIAENFQLEDLIKQAQAKFDEWAKPKKARIGEIENEIQRRLQERGADSTKTDAGTAYLSHLMNATVEDQGSLLDFVADNWDEVGADAKVNLKLDIVKDHMEKNEGKPPPGMSVSYYTRLNIRRT